MLIVVRNLDNCEMDNSASNESFSQHVRENREQLMTYSESVREIDWL
jgi:hypothetical protein